MTNEWIQTLTDTLASPSFIQATFSQPRLKSQDVQKVKAKQIHLKNQPVVQFEFQQEHVLHHENKEPTLIASTVQQLFEQFRQIHIETTTERSHYQISKKFKVLVKHIPKREESKVDFSHNRQKNYLLQEGTIYPFLVALGVQTSEGKIKAAKRDKFKQINRFVEMVEDTLSHLPNDRPIKIIDFGSGKSYLTFALYHYLTVEKQKQVQITGLDLKKEVIAHCDALAKQLNYEQLQFKVGDISDYTGESVDMVITLHACDVATDMALSKAVQWGAKVILSVPCCQHELANQIDSTPLQTLLKHGLMKERFSSLATDAIRAQLLTIVGYDTQLLEFIDAAHTPKNILIRAYLTKQAASSQIIEEYLTFKNLLHAQPFLENELRKQNKLPF